MMTLEKKTDHLSEALGHFVSQFKNKTKLADWTSTYITQIQEIEDVFWDLLEKRGLEVAEGAQLDGLGQIVGIAREGRDDDLYRLAIRGQILILRSSGAPEEILDIFTFITATDPFLLREYWPAAFTLEMETPLISTGPPPAIPLEEQYARILQSIKPAGVKAHFLWYESPDPFRFDSGPGYDQGHYGGAI